MDNPNPSSRPAENERAERAEVILAELFRSSGWRVKPRPAVRAGVRPDFLVRRGQAAYIVELKSASEGRSDRLIPLWAQAHLQALRAAGDSHPSLAVVAAPRIAPRVAEQVLKFAAEYAPDAAVGVIDFEGLRRFQGPSLEQLDSVALPPALRRVVQRRAHVDLFSDLNQWLLKVLLAPELPDTLLASPRGQYRNASQLARAAKVSVMSAFRFVQQLQQEGFLHESEDHLALVRREELFKRWLASNARRVPELPMRFVLKRDPDVELRKMLASGRACLGLFAAADALGYRFVEGVPPHVYIERFGRASLAAWKNLVPADDERPDLILRQPPAPQSIFRGMVRPGGVPASDILQVWLDVSGHGSRGQEQADLIERRVLASLISGDHRG